MTRFVKIVLMAFLMMLVGQTVFAEITVTIDEKTINFEEQIPVIINERAFVPLRKIFEELGASVDWAPETKSVFATRRFRSVSLTVGEYEYYVDADTKVLDAPPVILNDRVLIPIRAVSEAFGADVYWDAASKKISISLLKGDYVIKDKYLNGWRATEDGTVVMTYRAGYPEISDDSAVAKAFNERMKEEAEASVERGIEECFVPATDAYYDCVYTGGEFVPYMAEHSFDITHNSNNILSVIFSDCNFSGGFHPSYYMYSMTYNMETGRLLEPGDILSASGSSIRQAVYKLFENEIAKNTDGYYDDALDCLEEALSELKWYLADDGVHFYLNPYEIAPYAAGVVEVIMPY